MHKGEGWTDQNDANELGGHTIMTPLSIFELTRRVRYWGGAGASKHKHAGMLL